MNLQLILICSVIGCFLVAQTADGMVFKAAAALPPTTRERVFQRTVKWDIYLRILDVLGIILLILGILKARSFIKAGAPLEWGYPCMAVGFALLCLERIARSWSIHSAYSQEQDAAAVRSKAFSAALLVTVLEFALGVLVCWFVFTRSPFMGQLAKNKQNGETQEQTAENSDDGGAAAKKPAFKVTLVNEKVALEILGKDKAYLDLLVPFAPIRTQTKGDIVFYNRNDLESSKEAGLPTLDELKDAANKKPALSPNEIARQIEPLLKEGKKIEAIQKVRDLTGWDSAQAKEFVESLPPVKPPDAPPQKKTPEGEALQE
ncbi:MAG: hypothetical protein HY291_13080 [Planctomycetes bacterium]|nr:hypothetical protein [Planctomycetota bacterium]